MDSKLVVVLNGQAVVEYDRSKRLPGHQRQFLDKMDLDMDEGIELSGETIPQPKIEEKAKYVALHLVQSLIEDNDGMIAAMTAYLATRLPDLKQVKAMENNDVFSFDLIFDREYNNSVHVQFEPSISKPH